MLMLKLLQGGLNGYGIWVCHFSSLIRRGGWGREAEKPDSSCQVAFPVNAADVSNGHPPDQPGNNDQRYPPKRRDVKDHERD